MASAEIKIRANNLSHLHESGNVPDILITEFMDKPAVTWLQEKFDVAYRPDLVDRPEDIPQFIPGIRGLIVRNQTQVRGAVLEAADSLVCVGRLGVGLDNIDIAACEAKDVRVYPATGANSDSVAELTLGAIFCLLRGTYQVSDEVIDGGWPRMRLMGREVQGKHLGLAGFGAIGQALAWRSTGVGMRVSAWDPYVAADDPRWQKFNVTRVPVLERLIETVDLISLHAPLTDGTRDMINADSIARMKDGAIVLNPSRGGIVNEADLVAALKSGKLGGAFLDVFETEPLGPDNRFRDVPNLLLTPHVGARTREAETRVSRMIAEAVAGHLSADA